jgi:hypothetical protein
MGGLLGAAIETAGGLAMKNTENNKKRLIWAAVITCLTILACTLPGNIEPIENAASNVQTAQQPSIVTNQTPRQPQANSDTLPATANTKTNPLQRLLDLRSIQFTLATARPDGSRRTIETQIDAVGNMHVKILFDGYALNKLPDGFNIKMMPASSEVYVIDGKAYRPSLQDTDWRNTPVNDDFKMGLLTWLHGSDSPSLWLDLLPPGSIKKVGNESIGSFNAIKYSINGSVGNQNISGTLWEETQTNALVQAELHIPAALTGIAEKAQGKELTITLTVQKTTVPTITLPAAK